jgi:magnesium chelatase family protein
MPARVVRESCPLDAACELVLVDLVERRRALSARGIDRLIKVARTIADLDGQHAIDASCLYQAAGFRAVDPVAEFAVPLEGCDESTRQNDLQAAAAARS